MSSKPKPSKEEVRRLFSQTRNTRQERINSPLARYDALGKLSCIVCNCVIKNEAIWSAHLGSKQHKENFAALKDAKEKLVKQTKTGEKRRQEEEDRVRGDGMREDELNGKKRIKVNEEIETQNEVMPEQKKSEEEIEEEEKEGSLPADFFDAQDARTNTAAPHEEEDENAPTLPADFFDVPPSKTSEAPTENREDAISKLPTDFFDSTKKPAASVPSSANTKALEELEKKVIQEGYELFKKEIAAEETQTAAAEPPTAGPPTAGPPTAELGDEDDFLRDRDEAQAFQQDVLRDRLMHLKQARQVGQPKSYAELKLERNMYYDEQTEEEVEEVANATRMMVANLNRRKKGDKEEEEEEESSMDEEEYEELMDWRVRTL
ncbi:uncharacterized protein VTP21DRAFT_7692 [Calcarisporiella thermophila]|uniref:uncharacterized protein n=1 Tax=Calcarisporiella thermophila TaxID=911321 RepID=UPI0037442E74